MHTAQCPTFKWSSGHGEFNSDSKEDVVVLEYVQATAFGGQCILRHVQTL